MFFSVFIFFRASWEPHRLFFFRAGARTDPHQWGQISCSLFYLPPSIGLLLTARTRFFLYAQSRMKRHLRCRASAHSSNFGTPSCSSCERTCWLEVFTSVFLMFVWFCMVCTELKMSTVLLLLDQHKMNSKQQNSTTHIPLYMTPIYNSTIPKQYSTYTVTIAPFSYLPREAPFLREIRTLRQVVHKLHGYIYTIPTIYIYLCGHLHHSDINGHLLRRHIYFNAVICCCCCCCF